VRSSLPSRESHDELLRRAQRDVRESRDEAAQIIQRHRRFSAFVRMVADVMREQSAERVGLAASGAAFWLVISAFPTAIAVVSLYGLFVGPQRVATDLGNLANRVPGSLGSLLTEQLQRVAGADHAGLSLGFVVSVVLALSSSSAGVYHLDGAIRVAYGLPPQRYVEARGRALAGALAVVLLLGLGAVVIPTVAARLPAVLTVLGVPVALASITVAAAALFRFSVGAPVGARALVPGALASAIGVVLVTVGFGAYVAVSSRYSAVYGAFAGAVIGMLAIYLAVYVVLLGAVLNSRLGAASEPQRPGRDADGPRPGPGAATPTSD
jgi:membrane protein